MGKLFQQVKKLLFISLFFIRVVNVLIPVIPAIVADAIGTETNARECLRENTG
jgi:hypothetical protein